MKKLLLLSLLVGVFTFFSTTAVDAQNLGNRTPCTVNFQVVFGTAACGVISIISVDVPPFTVIPVVPPIGATLIAARTRYQPGLTCPNTVALFGCFGLPPAAGNPCTLGCGPYKTRISAWGVVAYQ